MAAVRASGLVKRFEATCAVDGVDLVVEPGEVRGLLGPNGAGKTTLLRLLLGLVTPDAGQIELDGRGRAPARVDEVLEQVGLAGRGDDRVSGYSTGMRQRLGSRGRFCARRRFCCSTSRPAGSTRPACATWPGCCAGWPRRERRSSSRVT